MKQKNTRTIELRAEKTDNEMVLEGLPIVFNQKTVINDPLGTYTEVIEPMALNKVDLNDIRFLYNHDTNTIPLARSPKTMNLELTPDGLALRAILPNTEQARSIYEAVKREDLSGCSFSFRVAENGDTFDKETNTRTIHDIAEVQEISIVPFPAYASTTIEARNKNKKGNEKSMKFKTATQAFNHWNNRSLAEVEARSQKLIIELETEEDKEITDVLSVELEGVKLAQQNKKEKEEERNNMNFNPINPAQNTEKRSYESTDELYNSKEYRTGFFKQLQDKELNTVEKRAMEQANSLAQAEKRLDPFNTVTDNAQVIPTETLNEVVRKARIEGGLLDEARAFNVPSNLKIPVGTPFTKAEWHTEGEEVEGEENAPVAVEFNAYELIKVFSMSAGAKKMSVKAFEAFVTDELVASVMEALGQALVNGTGSGQGAGLETIDFVDNDNLIEYADNDTPAYTDFTKAMGALKRGYGKNAKWAMNNATLYNKVYSVTDTTDRPIFVADPKGESIGKILGRDVIVDDNIADGDIYLGDFANYLGYNLPDGVALEVSTQSSFARGLVDYRALAIADTKVIIPEAFIKLAEGTEL